MTLNANAIDCSAKLSVNISLLVSTVLFDRVSDVFVYLLAGVLNGVSGLVTVSVVAVLVSDVVAVVAAVSLIMVADTV